MSALPDACSMLVLRSEISAAIRDGMGDQLDEMRRFLDRRVSELSAEIHATATMTEMTEASLAVQIDLVKQEVARMVSTPRAETRTSGLELEAVVQGTEVAANQIMEAAEAITDWISQGAGTEGRADVNQRLQTIFEACSFQDLTSQRIRRAIRHLEQVDKMLSGIASADPADVSPMQPVGPGGTGADLDQGAIDQLLNG